MQNISETWTRKQIPYILGILCAFSTPIDCISYSEVGMFCFSSLFPWKQSRISVQIISQRTQRALHGNLSLYHCITIVSYHWRAGNHKPLEFRPKLKREVLNVFSRTHSLPVPVCNRTHSWWVRTHVNRSLATPQPITIKVRKQRCWEQVRIQERGGWGITTLQEIYIF